MRKILAAILYSNSFYGIAAVALAIENNLVLIIPLNYPLFYLLLFCGTVAFYTLSYRYDPHPLKTNKRAIWISQHKRTFELFQYLLAIILITGGFYYWSLLPSLHINTLIPILLLLFIFPVLGFLYYGIGFPGIFNIRLRSFGWFKPFIIGAVWAGSVSFIPWILYHWMHKIVPRPDLPFFFFFLHNWMFISVLAILFDIKDFAADHNQSLKTFVVRKGLRHVVYTIVLPLTSIGVSLLCAFLLLEKTSLPSILIFLIPMGLLCLVALSLSKRRPVAWYLLVIDGLMLVKAFCGIAAMAIS